MAPTPNFSSSYAKALVAASKREDIKTPPRFPRVTGVTAADLRLMEREMTRVQRDFKPTEASYGQDMVALVFASGYVAKLIRNARIQRYLYENHPELLSEFRKIVVATSLDSSGVSSTADQQDPPRVIARAAKEHRTAPATPTRPSKP